MKKIFAFIIAAASLTTGFTSCSDFLDEDNKTGMTADLTYSTVSGIEGLVNNALKYIPLNTNITDTKKEQYYGEVKFLRALYYLQMVATWGPIPYNTEPVTAQTTTPVRMPEAEVYKNILKDIDESMAHFKAANFTDKAKNGGEQGRATYYAAEALKARAALYAASWLGNNAVEGYSNLYQIAQAAAEDVIANSGASFYSRYSDTWNYNKPLQDQLQRQPPAVQLAHHPYWLQPRRFGHAAHVRSYVEQR